LSIGLSAPARGLTTAVPTPAAPAAPTRACAAAPAVLILRVTAALMLIRRLE
jgi:hypothetical protein